MSQTIRAYSELIEIPTFEERFEYLRLDGIIGEDTFGWERYLNQQFYKSSEWKHLRDNIIIRDCGCDLAMDGYEIQGRVIIHHMNPVNTNDLIHHSDFLLNDEYLVCVSLPTHNAIHYGDANQLQRGPVERTPNDTCPWRI